MSYKKAKEVISTSNESVQSFIQFVIPFWKKLSKNQRRLTVINFAKAMQEL